MKSIKTALIAFILAIVMVFGVAGCNAGAQNELQSKIDDLQSRIEQMEEQIRERDTTIEDLNDQIKKQDEKIEELEKELAEKTVGELYSLYGAYENGWLTQEDLMSIAYYHNGGRWFNKEIMSEDYEPIPKNAGKLKHIIKFNYQTNSSKRL